MVQLAGQRLFTGSPENDVVSGTGAGDYLFGDRGNDTLSGLSGTDILRGYTGNDILRGGDGADGFDGGDGDDQLFGENGSDNLRSGPGRDRLDGGDGNDVLSGGVGQDVLVGGPGADIFVFDRIAASPAGSPDQILDFGPGDRIDISSIDAQASTGGGQTFSFIGAAAFTGEGQIRATAAGGVTLVELNTSGASGAEMVIRLENGAGIAGSDFIFTGNPNNDDANDQSILGDGGNITNPDIKVPTADVLFGGSGEDYINGGAKNDQLHGGPDNDIIRGDQSSDTLYGDEGHDVLDGYPGNDKLYGGISNDILRGREGNDLLDGGPGDDVLDGDAGVDTFAFTGTQTGFDIVADFSTGDRFLLDGVLHGFNGSTATIDQFVRFTGATGGSLLQIDSDGSGASAGWTNLAQLEGASGLDARSLFQAGRLQIDNVTAPIPTVNGLDYIASYGDLIQAFGANAAAGQQHYQDYGHAEGRTVSFDGLDYIASYGDLIQAFGANEQVGASHFITNGFAEQRAPDNFNEVQYVQNYSDLQAAFGTDYEAATQHYIDYGFAEGRHDFIT